ncbi:MAG: HNH endonuclease [Cyclobacteriaceae bacterium]|nr:HNH endonuclease [Cyclobacteriaceae bacterium]
MRSWTSSGVAIRTLISSLIVFPSTPLQSQIIHGNIFFMITHENLKAILNYNSLTGVFTWASPRPKIRVGQKAGYLHKSGYFHIEIKGKYYAAHRLAWFYMTGKWPKDQIDHINRNKTDNRFENLRECSNGQNRANSKTANKHGLKGISYKKWMTKKPWQAQITHKKRVIYLGCFASAEEAHSAYCSASEKLNGIFSRPNPFLGEEGFSKF